MSSVSPVSVQQHQQDGHIQVIFGPMFSGKTTELMRRIRRYTHAKKTCQVIKYAKDKRYDSEQASTHDRQKCEAVGCNKLSEVDEGLLNGVDVIGIDEGQFFPDCVSFADKWASLGKVVIVAALDATFERRPFGTILELIPLSEQVLKLNAVCMLCHYREASFTKRIGSETAVEVIGGADMYLSTCRECFNKEVTSPKAQMMVNTPMTSVSPIPHDASASASSSSSVNPATSKILELTTPQPLMHTTKSSSLSSNKRIQPFSPSSPLHDMSNQLNANGKRKNEKTLQQQQTEESAWKKQQLDSKENLPVEHAY